MFQFIFLRERPSDLFPILTVCEDDRDCPLRAYTSPVDLNLEEATKCKNYFLQLYWDRYGISHVIQWIRAQAHAARRKEKYFVRDKWIEEAKRGDCLLIQGYLIQQQNESSVL